MLLLNLQHQFPSRTRGAVVVLRSYWWKIKDNVYVMRFCLCDLIEKLGSISLHADQTIGSSICCSLCSEGQVSVTVQY